MSRVPVLRPCPRLSCTSTIQPWPACCPDGPPAPHPPWALVAPLLCRAGIGCRPRAPSGLSIFPARLSPAACLPPSTPTPHGVFGYFLLSGKLRFPPAVPCPSAQPAPYLLLPASSRAPPALHIEPPPGSGHVPQQPPRLGELTPPTSVSSRARDGASSSSAQSLPQPVLCKLYKERKEPKCLHKAISNIRTQSDAEPRRVWRDGSFQRGTKQEHRRGG